MVGTAIRTAILGASGYTGYELCRLLTIHRHFRCTALGAHQHAGKTLADVFGGFAGEGLPPLQRIDEIDFRSLDAVFVALPHCTSHQVVAQLFDQKPDLKIVDLSADFRFADPQSFEAIYGQAHPAPALLPEAVYGLAELADRQSYRRLVATPGCYPTAALLPLVPLVRAGLIAADPIIINAASSVTGAGRVTQAQYSFAEIDGSYKPYAVGRHRHAPEIDQFLSANSDHDFRCSFTPHLLPASRGLSATIVVNAKAASNTLKQALVDAYAGSRFVKILNDQTVPDLRHVRYTNCCAINVFPDRRDNQVILVSALDNLLKGAAGQAVQNMNILFGFADHLGLDQLAPA